MKKIALLCSGAVVAGSFVAGSLVAVSPADAATSIPYSCTGLAGLTDTSAVDTVTAPASMLVGNTRPVSLESALAVPVGLFGTLTTVTGTGGAAGSIVGPDGPTAIPASTGVLSLPVPSSGDLVLPLESQVVDFTPQLPGKYDVLPGTDTASLVGFLPFSCVPGSTAALSTIRVLSPSTTSVVVSPTTVAYGQADVASASIATSLPSNPTGLGDATGSVLFSVAGKNVSATLSSNRASARLPRLAAGKTYTVTGAYKPDSTSLYDGSGGEASLVVVKDRTRTAVSAPDIRRRHHEVASVHVRSVHGAVVRGRVRVVLKKGTHVLRSAKVSLRKGRAVVDLGRLTRRGRTYAVATYLGNGNFRPSRGKDGFAVK